MADKTQSEATTLAGALAEFQGLMDPVAKNRTAKIPGKDGKAGYSYKYADLSDILAAAKPHLAACKLAVTQNVTCSGGVVEVQTTVWHESGESFTTDPFGLPAGHTPQTAGSAATYARRYSLGGALGIAAEEDDDGAAATHSADATKAAPAASGGSSSAMASDEEKKLIRVKAKEAGFDAESLKAWLSEHNFPTDSAKLRKRQASSIIDLLEERIQAKAPLEEQLEAAGFEEDLSSAPEIPFGGDAA